MTLLLTSLIKLYKKLKALFLIPCACRFYPSCSTYALQAIEKYGPGKGLGLALRRLVRCSPLSGGGYDPVK